MVLEDLQHLRLEFSWQIDQPQMRFFKNLRPKRIFAIWCGDTFCTIPTISKILVLLSVIYVIDGMGAFGLSGFLRKNSQHLATRFMSFFYPDGPESSLIVLFDEDYLQSSLSVGKGQEKGQWPAPFADHARVLRTILGSGPEIVFYDIAFAPRNDNARLDSFLSLWQLARNRDIPVIMGYHPDIPRHPEIYENIRHGDYAAVSWVDDGGLLPRYSIYDKGMDTLGGTDSLHRIYRDYVKSSEERPPPLLPTAAFKLYELHLERDSHKTQNQPESFYKAYNKPLFVSWKAAVEPGPPGPLHEVRLAFRKIVLGIQHVLYPNAIFHPDGRFGQHSKWYTTIPSIGVRDLMRRAPADRKELIEGKTVFIGANLAGIPDTTASPIGGILPGVFYHAMAYDNLVQYGDAYKTDSEAGTILGLDFASVVENSLYAIILGIMFVAARKEKRDYPRPDLPPLGTPLLPDSSKVLPYAARRALLHGFVWLVSTVVVVGTLVVTWGILQWDSGNFLGLLSMTMALLVFVQSLVEFFIYAGYIGLRNLYGRRRTQ